LIIEIEKRLIQDNEGRVLRPENSDLLESENMDIDQVNNNQLEVEKNDNLKIDIDNKISNGMFVYLKKENQNTSSEKKELTININSPEHPILNDKNMGNTFNNFVNKKKLRIRFWIQIMTKSYTFTKLL